MRGRPKGSGEYSFDDVASLEQIGALVEPLEPGHWCAWEPDFRGAGSTIFCPKIDDAGHSWWHALLGRRLGNSERGLGIRIGVIDAGFDYKIVAADITEIDIGGGRVAAPAGSWIHGEAVCRILSDSEAPDSCTAIAPGAELLFASATYHTMTLDDRRFRLPLADFDQLGYLDPTLVVDAIYEMALNHDVDLINLSAGAVALPDHLQRGLSEAIETAAESGTLVVCAAGNSFVDEADFPARHPDCIGVGAFGHLGWGPATSAALEFCGSSPGGEGWWNHLQVFHWADSAYGVGVDTIGPGVGVLIARDGQAAFDVTGTSFASPIVVGMLAVEMADDDLYLHMPRDRLRIAYARSRLEARCQRTGMPEVYEGAGIFSLD
jgi:subtilisin family serine protease